MSAGRASRPHCHLSLPVDRHQSHPSKVSLVTRRGHPSPHRPRWLPSASQKKSTPPAIPRAAAFLRPIPLLLARTCTIPSHPPAPLFSRSPHLSLPTYDSPHLLGTSGSPPNHPCGLSDQSRLHGGEKSGVWRVLEHSACLPAGFPLLSVSMRSLWNLRNFAVPWFVACIYQESRCWAPESVGEVGFVPPASLGGARPSIGNAWTGGAALTLRWPEASWWGSDACRGMGRGSGSE